VQDRAAIAAAERPDLFERREVECAVEEPRERAEPLRWRPDPTLLVEADDAGARLAALRRAHAGRILTSYTRIRRGQAAAEEADGAADAAVAAAAEDETIVVALPSPTPERDELPGGIATGVLLHRLLEEIDPKGVAESADAATWLRRDDVAALFARIGGQLPIDAQVVPRAARLAWNALRTPLQIDGLALPHGLCAVERRAVEMELLFPIPEDGHPRLGDAFADDAEAPFRAGRGFVQGVVDLVFEHEGRTYFVDWKSDRLAAWDTSSIARHVAAHYELQAQLYALGVLRLLALDGSDAHAERFGGLLYCFLRGMGPAGAGVAGVYFARPSWDELRRWEDALRRRTDWGAA